MIQHYFGVDKDIIKYFMSTSKGIKATARRFGLPTVYVGKVILKYKKSKGIR
jgi:hypothetical protein